MNTSRFSCTDTGIRYIDEFGAALTVNCIDQGSVISDFSVQHEWTLMARTEVTFRANRAQFERARETALMALFAMLYSDVLKELPRLRLAISNGDRMAATLACDRIESAIRNEHKKGAPCIVSKEGA